MPIFRVDAPLKYLNGFTTAIERGLIDYDLNDREETIEQNSFYNISTRQLSNSLNALSCEVQHCQTNLNALSCEVLIVERR